MTKYQFLRPYTFKNGVTVQNQVVIPPMTECSAFEEGSVTEDELRYFRIHSGGAGLFISPVANVTPGGKGFEGELSVAEDRYLPGLTRMASAMKQGGSRAVLQIFHAGRMTNSKILRGRQPVSASAVAAVRPGAETPRAMTEAEIAAVIEAFGQATRRAIVAGFDGVELHGANTYLMQQFFSPHSNRRTDQWGGSLANRERFALAIIKRVHEVVDQYADRPFLIGYRISPEEIETPGIRLKDTLQFVATLANQPLDYLHVSQGRAFQTSLNDPTDTEPVIVKIRRQVAGRLPLIAVGSVTTPADAEKVMAAGIDLVALGREMLREPLWVQKVAAGDEAAIRYTVSPAELDELGITPPLWRFLTVHMHADM
ncbi:NADH-dependent flavin oxidoreductase [Lacticaseibacillus jixianensis]|uniref:NADH-dependent flavin oxidoreductase n=1 Tax=Lacticaseibacillus jixianensis TaxID=2486012 RepID=A0ABW4BBI8_9LACO|nr:NADH-dependent flavin oxidoreductase [Lacticaseibacillus jixianensis]